MIFCKSVSLNSPFVPVPEKKLLIRQADCDQRDTTVQTERLYVYVYEHKKFNLNDRIFG